MDADQALKVLIQFGVINMDQAQAAQKVLGDTIRQLQAQYSDLSRRLDGQGH